MFNIISKIIFSIITPYILYYAFYIQLVGDNNPGGGFQAGAIFASFLIGLDLSSSFNYLRYNVNNLVRLSSLGVLIYGFVGLISFLYGNSFLDYSILLNNPIDGRKIGIFLVELGIAITVSSTLFLIYINFQKEE